MKKLGKTTLSIILSVIMLISVIPAGSMVANAATGGVSVKIEELAKKFPSGKYFTVNGKRCTSTKNYCDNCYYPNVAKKLGYNWSNMWGSWTCCGWAHFSYRYIFGSEFTSNASTRTLTSFDNASLNSFFSKCKPGDIIYMYGKSTGKDGKKYDHTHYVMFLSYNSNSNIIAYDSNTGNENNVVTYKHSFSYNYIKNNHQIKLISYHANNYDKIDGITNYTISNKAVSNRSNESATIGFSVSPSATPSSWGFYCGTNKSTVDNRTATRKTVSSGTSCDVAKYMGSLNPNTTYYYRIWANVGGKEWYSSTGSFATTNTKPGQPTLSVASGSADIGIGSSPTVTWKTVSNVKTYTAKLYDENGNTVQEKAGIGASATSYTFNPLTKVGTYKAYIIAKNTAGDTTSTPVGIITVHPDVTVKFMDANPKSFVDYEEPAEGEEEKVAEELGEQTIHYGATASLPSNPNHTGYTFEGWNGNYKNVTEDVVVTAKYKINTYTVKFVSETGVVLSTQKINYYSAAEAPSYNPTKTGYVFTEWNQDYSHVKSDMTVTAVTDWYNHNYSVYTTVDSAKRDDDNNGYDVTFTIQNNSETLTTGRAVVVLKTTEGKMLTSTESSAFSIKADKSKTLDVFVPYENSAKTAYVYVVNNYKTMTPISAEASKDIDMGLDWTSWSTEKPAEGTYDELQSRTEYRYKTRSTTTSYDTSMAGWTQNGYSLVEASKGTIDYVPSWPSGYYKSGGYYSTYNKTPVTESENSTQKTVVSTSTVGYIYWHWCRGRNLEKCYNSAINDTKTSTFGTFHARYQTSRATFESKANAYNINAYANPCKDTYYWSAQEIQVKRCSYTTYNKKYNYYKISDWTEWSTDTLSSYETMETRTTYRYRAKDKSVEDTTGKLKTIEGKLDSEYANKQLTLYIYKIDEASDYSNEYLGQTVVDEEGNYSFTFKLREEPTIATGDFTVALGLEGATSLIYLDSIEAPREKHTVVFKDWDDTVISEQEVYDGEDAELPDESLYGNREGYTFSHWSTTNTNIKDDIEITAEYEINKYTVVFVDWEARTVQVKSFEHGAALIAPDFESTDDSINIVWDKIAEGTTTVTQDMVICTEYSPKTYEVTFRDYEGNIISTQTVNYGYAADVPELDTEEDKVFLDWSDSETGAELEDYIVTSKLDICPKYVFSETVDAPIASVDTGEYTTTQTVELTTATENAVIYYTVDGSDPAGENGIKYTKPIVVKDYADIRFYAVCMGMNDSAETENLYVINPEETTSGYVTFEQLPSYVVEDVEKYNVQQYNGYQFKNIVAVDTIADYEKYENEGWIADSLDYSEWTEWQDEEIQTDETKIAFEIETREAEYEVTSPSYKYSRYSYVKDGVTEYSNKEVEGFNGEWEYAEVAQSEAYKLAGFNGGVSYYKDANGGVWYNRTTGVLTETKTKPQYRSQYAIVTFYQWDEETSLELSEEETREYKTVDLYTYDYEKHCMLSIVPSGFEDQSASQTFSIVANKAKITKEDVPGMYGYTFDKLYKDAECEEEWNLANDVVTESTTLYATYTPAKFNVIFAYADGTEIETQKIDYLASAEAPETIELPEGYMFLGWDTEDYKSVTEDMVVHARYVLESEYSTVEFSQESASLLAGTQTKLYAQTSVPGKAVEWSSSDEGVAIVEDGIVTGVSAGTATITVTVADSGEKAECVVTVLTNASLKVTMLTNSILTKDTQGYIRGINENNNSLTEIRKEFANEADKLQFSNINDELLGEEDVIGTGTTVNLVVGTNVIDSMIFVMTGDMTGDGLINNRDVAMMNRYLVNKATPAAYQILAIDVNGDGNVNNRDAAMLARYLVGKETLK